MDFTGERFIPIQELVNDEIGYEHLHRYYSIAPLLKDKTVLDVACGEGYGTAIIAQFATSVVGVDIDAEVINAALDKYTNQYPNATFISGSASNLPFKNNLFDVVVSLETIEHLSVDMQRQFMEEIKRVLLPGGILIMSTPDKEIYTEKQDYNNPFHLHEFYKEEYEIFIKAFFSHVIVYYQGYEVVSIISNASINNELKINVINWPAHGDKKGRSGKYMIAIASDITLGNEYNEIISIVPDVNKDYQYLMGRLVTMNTEIEELGKWGQSLDNENLQFKNTNQQLKEGYQKIKVDNQQIENDIQLLKENNGLLKDNNKLLKKDNEQREEIRLQLKEEIHQHLIKGDQRIKEIVFLQESLKDKKNLVLTLENAIKNLDIEIEINKTEINEIKSRNNVLNTHLYLSESRLTTILASRWWSYALKHQAFKKKYLSNDSAISKRINNTINKFKKKYNGSAFITRPILVKKDSALSNLDSSETLVLPFNLSPLVSIIIPVFNNWEINYRCIKSILLHTENISYEVILADDCSSDTTKDCDTIIKNLVHIQNETNLGFLYNCNNAAKQAKGEYILFLNNDTEVTPAWLSSLLNLIKSDEKIGMVGSKLIYPDGRLQEAGGIIWNDASGWNYGKNQAPDASEFNYVKEVDYISGACILLSKKLWKKIGGFDEIYAPAYYEDSDLAFTIRKLGYKVMYQPLSQVIHHEGYSHGKDETVLNNEFAIKHTQAINCKKFYDKWKSVLDGHLPNAQNVFNARDRSLHKKTIVVIDHYVPHYDQDAGSKATFQYLELFISLGLNVKFIGDNFYRHEPYTTTLQQMGVEVLYGNWYHDNWKEWILENTEHIDFFYLNRPHITVKYIDFIKENTNAKILFLGHDLHFLREQRRYELEKNIESFEAANKFKALEISIFYKSDTVLTFSSVEKNVIAFLEPSFKVATIPLYCFKQIAIAVTDFSERKDILFVGGFGHTPNIDGVKWFCKEIWPLVKEHHTNLNFIVVGSNPTDEILALGDETVQIKGFVTDEELENLYNNIKLIVVPLRYGAGVKGKTVGSMYKGIPIVSTAIGIEGMDGDFSNFLKPFNDAKSFAEEVISLYQNEENQIKMSAEEVAYINQYFTIDAASKKMKIILGLNE